CLLCCTSPRNPELAQVMAEAEGADLRLDGVSRLNNEVALAELQRIANDDTAAREKRSEAIFSLFANNVKPPRSAEKVANTLRSEKWLIDANLYGVYILAGMIPVEWTFEDTVFCLHLFPDKKGWSDWVIYFRLSGGSGRSAEQARAFLQGNEHLNGSP